MPDIVRRQRGLFLLCGLLRLPRAGKKVQERRLVQHGNAELTGFIQLAARLFACHDKVHLGGNAADQHCARFFRHFLCGGPFERGQRAREDHAFARQRMVRRNGCRFKHGPQAYLTELLKQVPVGLIAEK